VKIPVLIFLQPGLLKLPDEPESVSLLRDAIASGVSNGLRATLKTGNLLTGRKEVALDYFPDASPRAGSAETARFHDYDEIPSVEAGAERIAAELNALLAKINSLPLEDTVASLNRTLKTMEGALASLDSGVTSITGIVNAPSTRQLPAELEGSLRELRTVLAAFGADSDVYTNLNASLANLDRTLENLNQLTRELSERPSSVLLGPAHVPDPVPEASR
jgi:paraquat-inducible protein B